MLYSHCVSLKLLSSFISLAIDCFHSQQAWKYLHNGTKSSGWLRYWPPIIAMGKYYWEARHMSMFSLDNWDWYLKAKTSYKVVYKEFVFWPRTTWMNEHSRLKFLLPQQLRFQILPLIPPLLLFIIWMWKPGLLKGLVLKLLDLH